MHAKTMHRADEAGDNDEEDGPQVDDDELDRAVDDIYQATHASSSCECVSLCTCANTCVVMQLLKQRRPPRRKPVSSASVCGAGRRIVLTPDIQR